jgi:hypothetical protein
MTINLLVYILRSSWSAVLSLVSLLYYRVVALTRLACGGVQSLGKGKAIKQLNLKKLIQREYSNYSIMLK